MQRWLHSLRVLALATLYLLVGVASCAQPHRPAEAQVTTRPISSEPVLATVNGSPILTSDLAVQTQSGQSAEQALRELIRQELLVQEAVRRQFDRDRRVIDVERRALVELLVRRTFRDQLGPAQIPRHFVEESYRRNLMRFQRPEAVEVSHILAVAGKKQAPAQHEAARRVAERARALATARPLTAEQFLAIGKQLAADAAPVTVHSETLTTPLRGFTVEPFADAAFALARPGAISPVTRTSFGYHVIYLHRRLPAINIPLAQAEAEIRRRILDEVRSQLLLELVAKLEKKNRVKLLPDNLTGTGSEASQ